MCIRDRGTEAGYSLYAEGEEFIQIASEEKRHGEELTNLAGAMRLSYMSSVILGLNDALVEFTGALAGLDVYKRQGVSRPSLDFDGRADHLLAVLGIDLAGHEFLGIVGAGLLVHHRVEVDGYPVLVERRDCFFQFVPRAVLGADSPFLVELPQIVQVVHLSLIHI